MPYIKAGPQKELLEQIADNVAGHIRSADSLNYFMSRILHQLAKESMSYKALNALVGAMECCKLEFVRMVLSPYEDKKRMENGPVSDLDAKSLEEIR